MPSFPRSFLFNFLQQCLALFHAPLLDPLPPIMFQVGRGMGLVNTVELSLHTGQASKTQFWSPTRVESLMQPQLLLDIKA
jgi:hypothetical protein